MFNLKLKEKEVVKCRNCKCLLLKEDAQKIEHIDTNYRFEQEITYSYYCPQHNVNYTRTKTSHYDEKYYKEMRVDSNGIPIGYQKEVIEKVSSTEAILSHPIGPISNMGV